MPKRRHLDDQTYFQIMEKVAEENNPIWNEDRVREGYPTLSVDEDYLRILNDNAYNYRGFYDKYPESAANADSHWPDEFKTVWHPTFSNQSIYSGKRSQYNPEGAVGGYWIGDNFYTSSNKPRRSLRLGGKPDNYDKNLFRNTNKAGDVWYTYQESPDSEEILLTPTNKRFSDDPTNWDYKDASGREYSPRMTTTYNPGEIREDTRGPLERMVDNYFGELKYQVNNNVPISGKYTMPAIAAAPFLAWAGEAAYPYVSTALANPYVDAGLTSAFAGHGLNHAINEGVDGWGDAAMTALELAPLGRLAKPILNEAALAVENYRYPLGRPQVPEGYITIKPQVRTRVGDIEIDNPQLAYRQGGNGIVEDFINSGKVRTKESNTIVDTGKGFTFDFGHEYSEPMFAQGQLNWGLPVGSNAQNTGLLTTSELLGVGNRQSRLVDNVVNGTTDIRMFPTRSRGVTGRVPLSEDQLNATNTTAYTWEPGYGYRRVFTEETPTADWPIGRANPQITAENAASITPEQWTAAQDAAIARGDMTEAQRLRDLHFQVSAPNTVASVNGQPLQLYHGTDATFNAFDISKYGNTDGGTFGRGIYTTPVKTYAELYGENNMPLYMKLDNPRDYRNSSIGDLIAEKFAFGDDFATGNGIDGVIGRPSWKGFKGLEEYVSHNPKNIKSSLPITYDDNGVRIPLGERDNFNINDIRYGLLPFGIGLAGYGLWNNRKQK